MLTSLFAARPEPERLNDLPATPMSGVVLRMPRLAAVVNGAAIGPGSGATPGIAGAGSGPGVATAGADRSSAPASTAPAIVSLCVILVLIRLSRFRLGGESELRDDRDRVVECSDLAGGQREADLHDRVAERLGRRDIPSVRPEEHLCRAVRPPVQGDVRLAGHGVVRLGDVVDREHCAGSEIEAPRAEHELLAA